SRPGGDLDGHRQSGAASSGDGGRRRTPDRPTFTARRLSDALRWVLTARRAAASWKVTQQLSGASWPPASGTEHLQFEDPMMALNDSSGSTNGFERGNHIDRVLLIAGCAGEPSVRSLAAPASPL